MHLKDDSKTSTRAVRQRTHLLSELCSTRFNCGKRFTVVVMVSTFVVTISKFIVMLFPHFVMVSTFVVMVPNMQRLSWFPLTRWKSCAFRLPKRIQA